MMLVLSNQAGAVRAARKCGVVASSAGSASRVGHATLATGRSRISLPARQERSLVARAGSDDVNEKLDELITTAKDKWADTEDKPTVITLAAAGLVTLIVTSSLLGALDNVPFLPGILELIGIGYSGFFLYKNVFKAEDREALLKKIDETKSKVL